MREEVARIHGGRETRSTSSIHFLDTPLVPVPTRLLGDCPVLVGGTHDAMDAIEHVPLTKLEARDIERLVLPVGHGRGSPALR